MLGDTLLRRPVISKLLRGAEGEDRIKSWMLGAPGECPLTSRRLSFSLWLDDH